MYRSSTRFKQKREFILSCKYAVVRQRTHCGSKTELSLDPGKVNTYEVLGFAAVAIGPCSAASCCSVFPCPSPSLANTLRQTEGNQMGTGGGEGQGCPQNWLHHCKHPTNGPSSTSQEGCSSFLFTYMYFFYCHYFAYK